MARSASRISSPTASCHGRSPARRRSSIAPSCSFRSLEQACPCGSAHQLVADVEGRLDDDFRYPGGVVVHPHVFRSVLSREAWIVEYQVRQTPIGAEALVIGHPATRIRSGERSRRSWRR